MRRLMQWFRGWLGAPSAPGQSLLTEAIGHHESGAMDAAEAAYRRYLEFAPDSAHVHCLLGALLGQQGRPEEAIVYLERAIAIEPGLGDVYTNLGNVQRMLGAPEKAEAAYRKAVELCAGDSGPWRDLGYLLHAGGRSDEAEASFAQAARMEPAVADNHYALAFLFSDRCDYAAALTPFAAALEADPAFVPAHLGLGIAYRNLGRLPDAVECLREAVRIAPQAPEQHNELGRTLHPLGALEEAIECFRRELVIDPGAIGALINLASAYKDQRELGEAIKTYERALVLSPGNADALNNMGNALKDMGDIPKAIQCFREAIDARPDFMRAHSNLLFTLQYEVDCDSAAVFAEHRRWGALYATHADAPARFDMPPRAPRRVLRIGYVSPDFRGHPIGHFIAPVLAAHDRAACEITCYSDVAVEDPITRRLRALSLNWVAAVGMNDAQLAERIAADGIDILVDLTGHTSQHRLRVFAQRAAPVQAAWIGYLDTTGIASMDYLIADAAAVPADTTQQFTEEIVRLPDCFLCYGAPPDTPAISPLPAAGRGYVTLGCCNNLAKISGTVIAAWGEILRRVPGARLVLKNSALRDAGVQARYLDMFDACGVDCARIDLLGQSGHAEYLSSYANLDLALDPFPFSGGTITCDALWMGVPVVTLAGTRMAGRTSASVLGALALTECIAATPEEYIDTAVALAGDIPRLDALRSGMRRRFARSALGDAAAFTQNLEYAYRKMWDG